MAPASLLHDTKAADVSRQNKRVVRRLRRRSARLARQIYAASAPLRAAVAWPEWRERVCALASAGDAAVSGRLSLRRAARRLAREIVRNSRPAMLELERRLFEVLPRARDASRSALSRFSRQGLMEADVTLEDVALETAWRIARDGLPDKAAGTVARMVAAGRFRHGMKSFIPSFDEPPASLAAAEETATRHDIRAALERLTETERLVLERRLAGATFQAIAMELGTCRQTVSLLFRKALRMLWKRRSTHV